MMLDEFAIDFSSESLNFLFLGVTVKGYYLYLNVHSESVRRPRSIFRRNFSSFMVHPIP